MKYTILLITAVILGLIARAYITKEPTLKNCNYVHLTEKILVCKEERSGTQAGAYYPISKTIIIRDTDFDTVQHEALHYLLYRDTNLTEEQQHKLINDLNTLERQINNIK